MFKVSVIVPLYNAEKILEECLNSIYSQSTPPLEVLVVDDGSTDSSLQIASRFPCRVVKMERNSGPAAARNRGALEARGDILAFVDSDAILGKDNLTRIAADFVNHSDVAAVSGTFSKRVFGTSWFNKFRNLQVFWWHSQSRANHTTIFMVTLGAIRKEVFHELGGFNTKYGNADVEDFEFGHRIIKKYKILFDKEIQFDHNHYRSPFFRLLKKLYVRTRLWIPLFMERKRFEATYANSENAAGVLAASLSLAALGATFFFSEGWLLFGVFMGLFLVVNRRFYRFLLNEEGFAFMVYSMAVSFLTNLVISAGAFVGIVIYVSFAGFRVGRGEPSDSPAP